MFHSLIRAPFYVWRREGGLGLRGKSMGLDWAFRTSRMARGILAKNAPVDVDRLAALDGDATVVDDVPRPTRSLVVLGVVGDQARAM